jgi:putative ABC transport system ATP-binding protein
MTIPPNKRAVLEVDAVVVSRRSVPVLDKVNFRIGSGEVVAVRGVSGAGKSTLLATMCGLLTPEAGATYVLGERLDTRSDRARSALRLNRFGLVFQDGELLPELTLAENVTLPLRLGPRAGRTADYRSVLEPLLSSLGIDMLAGQYPAQVSGGQLQRAAIARAVIHRPAIILADEPTEALDERAARTAVGLLIDLAREAGSAVVVVTHDAAVAARCDRSVSLLEGQLIPAGSSGDGA